MKTKKFNTTLLGLLSVTVSAYYFPRPVSANLNTATIMTSSASPSCAEWKVSGMCFWLFCTYFSCSVKTSVKVHHYIPEMVVSSYNSENPWTEMKSFNSWIQGGRNEKPDTKYTQYRFKNADAFGHPGGAITSMLSSSGYFCESQTTPFQPYFLSALDYLAWTQNIPEMFYPEAITPLMREVSKNGETWGNIYPRSGSVTQTNDYKASAVVVQRVADIVSRSGQVHIYNSATRSDEPQNGKWFPKEVKEGDIKTHKWQMLSPQTSQSCSVFPDTNALDTYNSKIAQKENYSFALWRPYSCCKRQGQTFLYSIDYISN